MLKGDVTEKDLFDKIKQQHQAQQLDQLLENTLLGPEMSNCSCAECDSLRCFTIRRGLENSICACNDCRRSATCILYPKNNNPESKPILKTQKSDENISANNISKNVDFCDKTSYMQAKNGCVEINKHSKLNYKASISDKKHFAETAEPRVKSYTRINSTVLKYPCKIISKTTAQLSAQIMNVPIQDFNQSLSMNNEDLVSKINNVKQDIFSRLKEIYKACSCKVCECIPVSSYFTRADMCSCKPCDCYECKNVYQYVSDIKETPHVGCPCIRCDRKDCRGITKDTLKTQSCNCKPCDCIKCSESFSKPCNCEPCKCLECRSMRSRFSRTVIVAPVQEHVRHNLCDCSPCECSNCTHNNNTTSNLQERSTGTVTHLFCPCDNCTNDSCQFSGENCSCEMRKGIMNKPIQRDRHDYDIRSLLISDAWPRLADVKRMDEADIMTMHETIAQNGLAVKVDKCECVDCKCLACIEHDVRSKPTPSTRPDLPHSIFNLSEPMDNVCKCEPCECKICNKDLVASGSIMLKETKCKCNICDCLNCDNFDCSRSSVAMSIAPIRQEFVVNYVPNHCKCKSCECVDCMKNNIGVENHNEPTHDIMKKDKTLTPSICKIGVKKSQKPSKVFLKAMTKDTQIKPSRSSKKLKNKQNLSVYNALSQHNYHEPSMTILDNNIDDSSTYFSAQNSNNELFTQEELSLYQYKTFDNVPVVIKDVSLFNSRPNTICIQNEISKKTLSSLHLLINGQIPQPFLDMNNINYIENPGIKYSDTLCDENIMLEGHKSNSRGPIYFKTVCDKDITAFDYDKVQRTLQDAQDFSVKLNKILETYEMANNNFVSISQRLRNLHETVFRTNCKDTIQSNVSNTHLGQNKGKSKYVGDSQYPTLNKKPANLKESSTSESSAEDESKLKPILGSHNLLENIDCVEFRQRIHKPDICEDVFGDVNKSGKVSQSKSVNYSTHRVHKRHKLYQGFNKHSFILQRLTSNNKVSQKQIASNFTETTSAAIDKKLYKSISTVNNEKQQQDISLSTSITCLFKDADFYKDAGTGSDNNYCFQVNDEECKKKKLESQLILQSNRKQEPFSSKNPPNNILRKNLYVNTEEATQNKYICRIPLLEVKVKEVIGIISREIQHELQYETLDTYTSRHSKTLDEKMYSNIRRYLNGLVARAILRSELKTTGRASFDRQKTKPCVKISRSYSKNETLKATFYNLRRISDHTVLVKWNIPQDITEVRGYEVDGRAVQKIFSPTRAIAVVTCLPHNEKVLLSIRTLTRYESCNPTTTTVYHPRNK